MVTAVAPHSWGMSVRWERRRRVEAAEHGGFHGIVASGIRHMHSQGDVWPGCEGSRTGQRTAGIGERRLSDLKGALPGSCLRGAPLGVQLLDAVVNAFDVLPAMCSRRP